MNVLYISQSKIELNSSGIYSDLINGLSNRGHKITIIIADYGVTEGYHKGEKIDVLGVKVGNQYGVNFIKKGFVLLLLEHTILKAIKKYLSQEHFDLVLYATPPITLSGVIKYCKQKFSCKSYLMLKDIFPQNAVDIGLIKKTGLSGLIYKVFRKKEMALYEASDRIGCMSEANLEYVVAHTNVGREKLEILPNAIECDAGMRPAVKKNSDIQNKYELEKDKTIFLYGGNLGRPQGLDFLAAGIKACLENVNAQFVIVGSGSEKEKLFAQLSNTSNVICINSLQNDDYQKLVNCCDVGMIMLDYRFTIPNYPSRILDYLKCALPIMACTDNVSDVKKLVEVDANCGKWCFSSDIEGFVNSVKWFTGNKDLLMGLGTNGQKYLFDNFNVNDNIVKIEKFFSMED